MQYLKLLATGLALFSYGSIPVGAAACSSDYDLSGLTECGKQGESCGLTGCCDGLECNPISEQCYSPPSSQGDVVGDTARGSASQGTPRTSGP